jgi:hypothetical protein
MRSGSYKFCRYFRVAEPNGRVVIETDEIQR